TRARLRTRLIPGAARVVQRSAERDGLTVVVDGALAETHLGEDGAVALVEESAVERGIQRDAEPLDQDLCRSALQVDHGNRAQRNRPRLPAALERDVRSRLVEGILRGQIEGIPDDGHGLGGWVVEELIPGRIRDLDPELDTCEPGGADAAQDGEDGEL